MRAGATYPTAHVTVTRRIGGLESPSGLIFTGSIVTRRIGGLENLPNLRRILSTVTRRIGGLEIA